VRYCFSLSIKGESRMPLTVHTIRGRNRFFAENGVPLLFLFWTPFTHQLCSYEHENTFTLFLGAIVTQINRQTSAAGIEFMDPALKTLIATLRSIRDQADSVLRKIDKPRPERSLAWKCTACGHVKHFTRPALVEVAAPCPKCGGEAFIPI